jgi:hypothetical protein
MINMRFIAISIFMLCISGCATGPTESYTNPSIRVEGMHADTARSMLAESCVTNGFRIETNTNTQLVCAKAFDSSFGAIMYRALLTPDYSTNPDAKVRYNFFENGSNLLVAVDIYIEYQNAFGQQNVDPINNVALRDKAQGMLERMKTQYLAANPPQSVYSPAEPPAPATVQAVPSYTAPRVAAPVAQPRVVRRNNVPVAEDQRSSWNDAGNDSAPVRSRKGTFTGNQRKISDADLLPIFRTSLI